MIPVNHKTVASSPVFQWCQRCGAITGTGYHQCFLTSPAAQPLTIPAPFSVEPAPKPDAILGALLRIAAALESLAKTGEANRCYDPMTSPIPEGDR